MFYIDEEDELILLINEEDFKVMKQTLFMKAEVLILIRKIQDVIREDMYVDENLVTVFYKNLLLRKFPNAHDIQKHEFDSELEEIHKDLLKMGVSQSDVNNLIIYIKNALKIHFVKALTNNHPVGVDLEQEKQLKINDLFSISSYDQLSHQFSMQEEIAELDQEKGKNSQGKRYSQLEERDIIPLEGAEQKNKFLIKSMNLVLHDPKSQYVCSFCNKAHENGL